MKKKTQKVQADPRRFTPEAQGKPRVTAFNLGEEPEFFSYADLLVSGLILFACLLVATLLWLNPTHIRTPTTRPERGDSTSRISMRSLPKFKPERYEEVSDDNPEFNEGASSEKRPSAAPARAEEPSAPGPQ